ncbi:translation initiation factor IF-2 [Acetobacter oeni]|uniref:Translation initiation factor IF-2 n=1 Tax=Acetobacter oeni TaxID=304077 RepID=A0A511XI74_9PROT|nr:translation initiation factor IF-2 [Acetobacter oeni]MBB3883040.1 translation initiation factor IF-2 [Acetobacter oeni]NHO19116.1 translation initiation factor IF-2 [Acetobacter oeni]GEN62624.1 translation initiation factor IF-2 [Acetobacter oeni]
MSEGNDQDQGKGRLSLRPAGRSEVGHTVDAGSVRQSFSHGRSKVVQVEVRKKSRPGPGAPKAGVSGGGRGPGGGRAGAKRGLTDAEVAVRQRVLDEQRRESALREAQRVEQEKIQILSAAEEARRKEEDERRLAEEKVREEAEARDTAQQQAEKPASSVESIADETGPVVSDKPIPGTVTLAPPPGRLRPLAERAILPAKPLVQTRPPAAQPSAPAGETLRLRGNGRDGEDDRRGPPRRGAAVPPRKGPGAAKKDTGRRSGRIDVQAAIEGDDDKTRSLASVRRQRERERRQAELERLRTDQVRVVRDVVLPETITVQELANRMAARQGEVIKALMKMGVMATVTQSIDADTAELVVEEFGHRVRRVADSDVEIGIEGVEDKDEDLLSRPPVVTVMGHVDHGKTSLLDALRTTDTAAGEAGGITQHIGAYQVKLASGAKITFIDTPGHEAFTAMRARGAAVTDVVVLVVAADDGVMPQTIEAIKHANAADAPVIVAINKMDKPGANPARVRQDLLSHGIVVESMGGDVQDIEVSALKKTNLDKLEEAILLQAEILDLKANPDRAAEGVVIEGRLDRGRGPVSTVLVQKGTLRKGDIVVAGAEWGRVRALLDDRNRTVAEAGPSMPVEVLGIAGVPEAGSPFVVVENENRAREISEFRQRKIKEHAVAGQTAARGTLDQMLARIQAGVQKEVAVLVKADVQGSAEAIRATVEKLAHEEVAVRVLNATVGQITESDVQLAKASDGIIIAFNVRATSQAREMAQRDGVDIRYYSIIYQVADDIEQLVKGKIAPKHREKFLGYAEIRQVFNITKVGKVAGCYVTEGLVKRGCGVRLLRDGVVIHEGDLSQLKRFKDDVKEVARGYECGLSFAGYNDLREGDVVECYEMELVPA